MTANIPTRVFCVLAVLTSSCTAQWNTDYEEKDDEYVLPIVLPIVAIVLIACIIACCWQGGKCPCSKTDEDKKKDLEKGAAVEAARKEHKLPQKTGVRRPHQISDVPIDTPKRNKALPSTPEEVLPPSYHLATNTERTSIKRELPGQSRRDRQTEQNVSSSQSQSRVKSQSSRRQSYKTNEYPTTGSRATSSSRRHNNSMGPPTRSSKRNSGEYRGRENEGYSHHETSRRSHRSSGQYNDH